MPINIYLQINIKKTMKRNNNDNLDVEQRRRLR